MHTQIQKWGNSLGIRIPQKLAKKLNLHSGSEVEVSAENNNLLISKSYSELDMLLERITKANCQHELLDDDNIFGNESW